MFTLFLPRLPSEVANRYKNFSPVKKQLNNGLTNRNGLIVEYNETIYVLLRCNTSVSILESEEQEKSTLCYLLKYITKPPSEITDTICLIQHARQKIEQHPSVTEISGTERRTAMHFLNRIANQISSTVKVSSSFTSLAILDNLIN